MAKNTAKDAHGMLRLYSKNSVYEESLNRIRYLFDEFEDVVVSFSGGKDSTIIFNLALIVAREKNRLPLKVLFLDQESELESTITMVRQVMSHPDVYPMWFQIPFRLFNATSSVEHWLECWNTADESRWMRPKEPNAITENTYGTDRFVNLLERILTVDFADKKACALTGMRVEESPRRAMACTHALTYKHVTWGRKVTRHHFNFHPIYDWTMSDVWKAIHDNGWPYSSHYDSMYRHGVAASKMRVSSLNHETSISMLFMLHEIEPDTYGKMTARLQGIDMAAKMNADDYFPKKLPFMFSTWREYRDHLLRHLIDNVEWSEKFEKDFKKQDEMYHQSFGDKLTKTQITSLLTNDWEGVKMKNFTASPDAAKIRKAKRISHDH